jgi:hypothetical protein
MTSIGRRCTRREALSRAVLIARGLAAHSRTQLIFFSCFHMLIDRSSSTQSTSHKSLAGGYGAGGHLFPSRTEKLSPAPPMILASNPVK